MSDLLLGVENRGVEYTFAESAERFNISADDVVVQESVNYNVAGVYAVEISFTSESGVKAITTVYVVVEE